MIDDVMKAINNVIFRVQSNPYELQHLLELSEQYPDISLKLCPVSPLPYQVYDGHYFINDTRYNNHFISIPMKTITNIINNKTHNGMSVIEYTEYTSTKINDMTVSDFITAIIVHELSHVFQLYIQDYYSEDDHTIEFYDVLEGFYCSDLVTSMKLVIDDALSL